MDSVVKMKSLPFDATQLDIIQFFDSFKLKPNGVQLVVRSDNKPTGEVSRSGRRLQAPCHCPAVIAAAAPSHQAAGCTAPPASNPTPTCKAPPFAATP